MGQILPEIFEGLSIGVVVSVARGLGLCGSKTPSLGALSWNIKGRVLLATCRF